MPLSGLCLKAEEKISLFFKDWEGTPYRRNTGIRNIGVDCGTFIYCFLDAMFNNKNRHDYRNEALQLGKMSFEAIVRFILFSFPHIKETVSLEIEPGDILIIKKHKIYHAIIRGIKPGEFWHCCELSGVVKSGIPHGGEIDRIYRPLNKDTWK